MLKEIFEQPETVTAAMRGRLNRDEATAVFGGLNLTPQQLRSIDRIVLTACGTSWHSALVGEYMIENVRPHSGRSGIRQRAALPQSADVEQHAAIRHHAKRRNDRHTRCSARDETQRAPHARHLQCRRQHDRPRGRRRRVSARWPGNRRRLDEGLHVAMRGDGPARPLLRPNAPPEFRSRPANHRRAHRATAAKSKRHSIQTTKLAASRPNTPHATTSSTSAANSISRPPWKAHSSSRKSATSTPRATRPPK